MTAAIVIDDLCKDLAQAEIRANGARPGMLALLTRRVFGLKPKATKQPKRAALGNAGDKAIDHLSMTIAAGSVVAVMGSGSSGAATLLRVLAQELPPTSGRIELFGAIESLLTATGDMKPDLTLAENVREHIQFRGMRGGAGAGDDYLARVRAFARLDGFEDLSVRQYSTGMRMRLGMAMALESDAEILVLGDVLEVGDITFQNQCIDRVRALRDAGKAILLHLTSDDLARRVADRIVTFHRGAILSDLPVAEWSPPPRPDATGSRFTWKIRPGEAENEAVALSGFRPEFDRAANVLRFSFRCTAKTSHRLRAMVDVGRGRTYVFRSLHPGYVDIEMGTTAVFSVAIPADLLVPGTYGVNLNLVSRDDAVHRLKTRALMALTVAGEVDLPPGVTAGATGPLVDWDLARGTEAAA